MKGFGFNLMLLVVSTLLVSTAVAQHKKKKRPPLLLLPDSTVQLTQKSTPRRTALVQEPAPQVTDLQLKETLPPSHIIGFGAELGFLSKSSDTSTNFLGQNFAPGGRVYTLLPIDVIPGIFVKPSLGFFRYSDGSGVVSINVNEIEGGGSVLYQLVDSQLFEVYAGLAQYLELDLTSVAALGQTFNSPAALRYRFGPAVDLGFKVSSDVSILTEFQYTFTATNPVIPYAGFTAGILYRGF
jgi:hypothetical protein